MEFRLLGPVEVVDGGRALPVGGPKPRTLLAVLALSAGRTVPVDSLIDAVWGEDPPDTARAALHTYVSSIRRSLKVDVISRDAGGYRLDGTTDHKKFIDLVARARVDQDPALYREALGLWRGEPLGGAQGTWADNERARLGELRYAAIEERVEAELQRGDGTDIAELTSLVAGQPLRERLRAQLMRALHQAGRQADALAVYQEGRTVLDEELGLEPGAELRQAHDLVLQGDDHQQPEPVEVTRPSQLPFDIADFTGRRTETAELLKKLRQEATGSRLCAVYGKPGAGKSTLAMHVAHLLRDDFPDGQLYASLRGVQTVRSDPAEVLGGFLRALGVADLPQDLDERTQLYRSLLANRRVLVVLDDASDERQVRPLLPGGHTSAVLVTSRERLSALEGAAQLDLGVLDDEEALELLDTVVGNHRVRAELDEARDIVRLCGHLPLALRIAGARLAARPQWQLRRLADRLRVQHRVLQELTLGDLEVRGSLALSYDGLEETERAALRRLGLLDVSSFGGWVVGPLLGCDRYDAEDVVQRLVDAQLLDDTGGDRYQLHDLTRAFARERGEAEETDFATAATRAAEAWLALVETAGSRMPHATFDTDVVNPHLDADHVDEILADPEAWFDAEQTGLVGVVERVSELDLTDVATRLAAALCSSRFSVRNLFGQWWRTHSAALEAARRAGDTDGEARLLAGLGWLRYEQDRFDEAASCYQQSLVLRDDPKVWLDLSTVQRETGQLADARASLDRALADLTEPQLRAQALHGLGRVLTEQDELTEALSACEEAVRLYTELGDDRARAIAVRSVGIVHRAAGRLDDAARWCEEAVTLLRGMDDPLMSAYAVQALAKVRIRQGRGAEVHEELLASLAVCNEMGDGFGQALVLRTLGELHLAAGDYAEAVRRLERSVQWWEALGLPVWRERTARDLQEARQGEASLSVLKVF